MITKKYLRFYTLSLILFCSCHTFNHTNPYPNMMIEEYENSNVYIFENKESSKLIINIEGSGWYSALGVKGEKRWLLTHQGAQILQVLSDDYSIIMPEKLNRELGMNHYYDEIDRQNYTLDRVLEGYLNSINGYLKNRTFSSIVLIGSSEGAALLPLIYENLKDSYNISAMVSYAFGGLSLYESYKILAYKDILPIEFREMYKDIIKDYDKKQNSIDHFHGLTPKYFQSFIYLRPIDHYKSIKIPVLFIHGEKDINVPVESTIYVEESITNDNFYYDYYTWGHQPESYFDTIELRENIANWIKETDK